MKTTQYFPFHDERSYQWFLQKSISFQKESSQFSKEGKFWPLSLTWKASISRCLNDSSVTCCLAIKLLASFKYSSWWQHMRRKKHSDAGSINSILKWPNTMYSNIVYYITMKYDKHYVVQNDEIFKWRDISLNKNEEISKLLNWLMWNIVYYLLSTKEINGKNMKTWDQVRR